MTVKEIIRDALYLLGRVDVAEEYENGQTLDGEKSQVVKTLLYCFNAVQDELARAYFPLTKTEKANVIDGVINLTCLSEKPVRILSVYNGEYKTDWRVYPEYIKVKGDLVSVEYEYCPAKKGEEDSVSFGDVAVGPKMVAYGMSSEYCIINGEIESANTWESKYRQEIDKALLQKRVSGRIPPRRWV